MYILAGRAVRGSSPTQFSVCLGQTVSGFSAWWCAPTAHLNISPEGKAFALTVNSYISIVLIKNMDSYFTAGLLQGIKREHFSTLCIWSDSTWQASQGIWMLFSSEELAQGASSTGTGRLKPIPHTGIPRNSEPTWCLRHIPDSPYSVYVSYGREVSDHKILHTQLFIQECARLTPLTSSRWQSCSLLLVLGATHTSMFMWACLVPVWTTLTLAMRSVGESYPMWEVIFSSLFSKTHCLLSSMDGLKSSGGIKHHSSYFGSWPNHIKLLLAPASLR